MGKKRKPKPTHPVRDAFPECHWKPGVCATLGMESDRGSFLVGVALLDSALLELLKAFFQNISQDRKTKDEISFLLESYPAAPIGALGTRIKMCYVLGLISETIYKDLKQFTATRNAFAHLDDDFEILDSDIPKFLNLTTEDEIHREITHFQWTFETGRRRAKAPPFSKARLRFMTHVMILYYHLIEIAEALEKQPIPRTKIKSPGTHRPQFSEKP